MIVSCFRESGCVGETVLSLFFLAPLQRYDTGYPLCNTLFKKVRRLRLFGLVTNAATARYAAQTIFRVRRAADSIASGTRAARGVFYCITQLNRDDEPTE